MFIHCSEATFEIAQSGSDEFTFDVNVAGGKATFNYTITSTEAAQLRSALLLDDESGLNTAMRVEAINELIAWAKVKRDAPMFRPIDRRQQLETEIVIDWLTNRLKEGV